MNKVILICGKICSGKTFYARQLQQQEDAVILSTDEATFDLIENQQGAFYDQFAPKVNRYLRKKAVEIVKAGANVILDWGFWTKRDRDEISSFLDANKIPYEWHYIDISHHDWKKNITERNCRINAGMGSSDFYVDDGLMKKLLSAFEEPKKEEIDVWHHVSRT